MAGDPILSFGRAGEVKGLAFSGGSLSPTATATRCGPLRAEPCCTI
ncbi:hypothetical protein FTUN_1731 [Frigoriglobus tundricola]|uniref:Uncharacterized protein n=1 Tax=Frigoriglobus tundricola TaxID=2774151 RepID=A0A6M5YLT1_9BACT|nr:hypothetical protein FTUN_1731 [Frigoriglobus tundricola]